MRTSELIDVLARDARPRPEHTAHFWLNRALFVGALVSFGLLLLFLGLRSMPEAVRSGSFWMKAIYTLTLSIAGVQLVRRLSRPEGTVGAKAPIWIGSAVGMISVLAVWKLVEAPSGATLSLWLGHTWKICSVLIAALSIPIYPAVVLAMRRLAPTRLFLGGAAAGFTAGSIAATIYGLHCPETSPAFVVTWYTLGILSSSVIGGFIGRRALRW